MEAVKNQRNRMGGAELLASIGGGKAALAFLDPQYRGVLDKLKYGNEGKRQIGRAALKQMSDSDIAVFVEEIERALKPSGHLCLWVDKFTVVEGRHLRWLRRASKLRRVDMISWRKTRPGMGRRARCFTEFMIVLQKEPTRAAGVWRDKSMDDCWIEGADREAHVHAKPIGLTMRMIKSVTRPRDLVIDPCAGGYGVLDACLATGRTFLGCDLVE
jgi:site-specific DNA-methyltransferase (adenine-specific)